MPKSQCKPNKNKTSNNIFLSKKDFKKEEAYQLTMLYIGKMLNNAIITEEEYCEIEARIRQKYKPIFVPFIGNIVVDK